MSRRPTRDSELLKAKYAGWTIIDSEEFTNIAYAIDGDRISVMEWLEGRLYALPGGTVDDMRRLADEIIDVCDMREGLKDWGGLCH